MDTGTRHKLNTRPLVDPLVILLEITEDKSGVFHRAAAYDQDVTRDGETFSKSDISVTLPKGGDTETASRIRLNNTRRIPSRAALTARRTIGVRLFLVHASDPDTSVKFDTKNLLVLKNINVSNKELTGNLSPRLSLNEPYPRRPATKAGFPGAWFSKK